MYLILNNLKLFEFQTQLYLLWSGPMVSALLGQSLAELVEPYNETSGNESPQVLLFIC